MLGIAWRACAAPVLPALFVVIAVLWAASDTLAASRRTLPYFRGVSIGAEAIIFPISWNWLALDDFATSNWSKIDGFAPDLGSATDAPLIADPASRLLVSGTDDHGLAGTNWLLRETAIAEAELTLPPGTLPAGESIGFKMGSTGNRNAVQLEYKIGIDP